MFALKIIDRTALQSPISTKGKEEDLVLDSPEAYLSRACQLIEDSDAAELVIHGFGRANWSPAFGYEGLMVLEELPDAIACLRKREEFKIGIMAQGTESEFEFYYSPDSSNVNVRCISYLDGWKPNPECETIAYDELLNMLESVRDTFVALLSRLLPELYTHSMVKKWVSSFD